jgi:hypothetical protein
MTGSPSTVTGPTGATGETGGTGPTGPASNGFTILAAAHVDSDGTLLANEGFASSTIVGGTVYVLTFSNPPPFNKAIVVANATDTNLEPNSGSICIPRQFGSTIQIRIIPNGGNTLVNSEFYIIVVQAP